MLFSFLFRNLKGYRRLVALAIVISITQVFCGICAAFPLKWITSKVSNPGNDPTCTFGFLDPILTRFDTPLIDPSLRFKGPLPPVTQCPVKPGDLNATIIITHHSVNGVIVFSVLALVVFGLLIALLGYLALFLATYIAQGLSLRLRNQLFDHLQRLSLDWHGKQKKGDLVQRLTGNIADIEKLVTDGLVDLMAGVLTLLGVALVMWIIDWQYTLISLAIAPALFVAVMGYTRNIKLAAKKAAKATGQVADVATEDINALTVIKVFTREERESSRFGGYVAQNRRARMRAGGLQAQFTPLVALLSSLGVAVVIGVGGYVAAGNTFSIGLFTIQKNQLDIGTLILFLTFLGLLYQPMRDLSKLAALSSGASSAAERIQEVLDQAPEVIESQVPYHGPTKLKGEIVFEHVIFGYVADRPVLKGINLRIPQGRKIALVGLSGGGKTTLVKLIPRFYEVQQGSVKIDGLDNRMYPLHVLRQNVSMVLQDSVLFEGTIRENIAIGRPDATDEEIVEAAKRANIHDAIESELGGYDRLVREQGKDLSGGQRQRIAIARAILRDAPILILDEPTAALDVEAEAEVMHALDKLIVGRTVIMISHRLSTLGNVEEIIVLKDGRIAERGSFRELKRKGGVFAALLEEQNRYNLEKVAEATIVRSAFAPPLAADGDEPPARPVPARVSAKPALASRTPRSPTPSAPARASAPVPTPTPTPATPAAQATPASSDLARTILRRPAGVREAVETAAAESARVVVEVNGVVVGERRLDQPMLTIGRRSQCDIPIPSDRVSRLHARILHEGGAWIIEDAESLNGLLYDGHHVDRLTLHDQDRIYLSPTAVLRYEKLP